MGIERVDKRCKIGIFASKPGIIIGKKGIGIDQLKTRIMKLFGNEVSINIYEIKNPEVNAQLISDSISQQIEKRAPFRRSIKRAVMLAQKNGYSRYQNILFRKIR